MSIFSIIPAWLYSSVYYCLILLLCLITILHWSNSTKQKNLRKGSSSTTIAAFGLCAFIVMFLGLRPISWVFGDTMYYAHSYGLIESYIPFGLSNEWIWHNFTFSCKSWNLPVQLYFFIIACVYFGCMLWCSWRLFKNNTWIAFLFCLASFSCYSYGVNGLRNGLACSLIFLSFSYVNSTKPIDRFLIYALLFTAIGIHHSTTLPAIAMLTSMFLVKNNSSVIKFWFLSIFISLIMGHTMEQLFASLGFDSRMDEYFNANANAAVMDQFAKTGFRFDFLLYSSVPIYMVWYVTIKRKFQDKTYNIIANTYILSNAFWVMVIRAAYSNRFAYLSWFMYPLVIVYPLLRFNIWRDQDRRIAWILFLYEMFTFIMYLIG